MRMMKRVACGVGVLALLLALPVPVLAEKEAKDYSKTINEFKKIDVVAPFFSNSYGYAVFPTIGKGGLIVGGSHGKGQVYEHGKLIGFTSTSEASVGLQAGGQSYSQVIFFENKEALQKFTEGNFEFSASASAIAVQATAGAKASTEGSQADASGSKTAEKHTVSANYENGMVVFTMAKGGLMAGATIAGQKYTYKPV